MSVKTFAAIDVGSFELTMKIFDLSGNCLLYTSWISRKEAKRKAGTETNEQTGHQTAEKQKRQIDKHGGNGSQPVSYTHLDVYKRQFMSEFIRSHGRSLSLD